MFDPYHKWLGIPRKDQPPHHYRLLALDLFESDPEVIDAAANRQMAYVQQRATGGQAAISQKLLNELSAARLCLLDPKKKAAYDAGLRAKLSPPAEVPPPIPAEPVPAVPDPLAFLVPTVPPPAPPQAAAARRVRETHPGPAPDEQDAAFHPPYASAPPLPPTPFRPPAPSRPAVKSRRRPEPAGQLPKIIAAVGTGFLLALALVLYLLSGGEKPATVADKAGKPGKGRDADPRAEKQPEPVKPAIYEVQVEPPFATLVVKNHPGAVSGDGRLRKIRIDRPSERVLVEAFCEGYRPSQQWLDPRPGRSENLRFALEKMPLPEVAKAPEPEKPPPDEQPRPDLTPPAAPPAKVATGMPPGAMFIMTFEPDPQGAAQMLGTSAYAGEGHGMSLVEGKVGRAAHFGNGAFLIVKGRLPFGQNPRSVSVWLRASPGKHESGHALVYGDPRPNNQIFCIQIFNGTWHFSAHGGIQSVDTHVAVDAAWHHHCLVYDGNVLTYTIDGAPAVPIPMRLNTPPGVMCLGGLFGNRTPFDGDMDELALFDRALTPEEVQRLYEMGNDGVSLIGAVPAGR